jgi:hypothetical protein
MSRRSVALLGLALALVAAPGAAAQTGGTLDGETLNAVTVTDLMIDCEPTGTSTVSYAVAGAAVGPLFPGTFEEWGSYTIVGGVVTNFEAAFIIQSGATQIAGSKTLGATGTATCTEAGGLATTTIAASTAYEATIPGPFGPSTDTGTASVAADLAQTVGGPAGVLQETFASEALVGTTGHTTGGGSVDDVANGTVSFAFSAKSDGTAVDGRCLVIAPDPDTRVTCLDATLLARTATHATFIGTAEVNGEEADYRIDVDDLGEPGVGRDTFRIQAGAFVAAGVLASGNVQIHAR